LNRLLWECRTFQRRKPAAIGVTAPLPGFIEPARASPIEKVPSGDRWIHEIKFDGYRVQVHPVNEAVKIFTRRGNDWTKRFKKVAHDAWRVKAASAVIDGEIVVPAADGTTDFSMLQNELKGSSKTIVLVAFDLLYLNGQDIRKVPLAQRKAELKKIIGGTDVQFSESFEIDGSAMFAQRLQARSRRRRLEGPRWRLPERSQQRLGQEDLHSAGDADHRRLRARRGQVGRHLSRPSQG